MSLDEYRGAAFAVRAFMRAASAEIASGAKSGARRIWTRAHPAKVKIGWFQRRVLRGRIQEEIVKKPTMAERQRAFRAKHAPELPPFVGVYLRPGDIACLAAGQVTATLQVMAAEAMQEFFGDKEESQKPVA